MFQREKNRINDRDAHGLAERDKSGSAKPEVGQSIWGLQATIAPSVFELQVSSRASRVRGSANGLEGGPGSQFFEADNHAASKGAFKGGPELASKAHDKHLIDVSREQGRASGRIRCRLCAAGLS